VDRDGRTVWLTGANWFGFNASERTFHGIWSVNLGSTIAAITQRGINSLRVPISTQLLNEWRTGQAGAPGSVNYFANPELEGMNTLQVFDYFLQVSEQYGLKVVLDVHSAEADNSGHVYPVWYKGTITPEIFYATWDWVADRYKNNDTLIAFDIKNEPHGKHTESPRAKWDSSTDIDNWKHACQTASNRILAINPNVLVFCEGTEIYPIAGASWTSTNEDDWHYTWWGGNLRGAADHPINLGANQDQLVYSPHDYGPAVWLQPWFEGDFTMASLYEGVWYPNWFYLQANNVSPLFIGEWGGHMDNGANQKWLGFLRDFILQNHIHHSFWCINPNSGDTGGLIGYDWVTWDEVKYGQMLKPVLWQNAGGKFVGLDHEVPLGGAGSTTGVSLGQFYSSGGTPPNP
jgi:endoglucanase